MINLKMIAKNCHNCREWIHICDAECCKTFNIAKEQVEETNTEYIMHKKQKKDLEFYYTIHGGEQQEDKIIFKKNKYQIEENEKTITLNRPCDYLDQETKKCKHHKDGKRPTICKEFNENTGLGKGSYTVQLCLANYKK